jgi:tetratricopeptide (TPR) repeat protein
MKRHASRFRSASAGIAFLMTATAVSLQAQPVQTDKPVHGRPVTFQYRTPESKDAMVQPTAKVTLLLYPDLSDAAIPLSMTRADGSLWKAVYTPSDTAVRVLYFAFRIQDDEGRGSTDDDHGSMYDMLMVGPNGRPVERAHEARALSYTGITARRPENLDKALEEVKKELVFYPGNLSARNMEYTLMLKQSGNSESVRQWIAGDIRSLLKKRSRDESSVRFAASAFRMIGESGEAGQLENELVRKNPRGEEAARKALSEIMQVEEAKTRMDKLVRFRSDYPGTAMDEFVLSQIVTASIETDDAAAMDRTGTLLLQKASGATGANALAALAMVYADKKTGLDRAEDFVRKALSIAGDPPGGRSDADSKDQKSRTEGRYRDVLGWVLLQKGDLESARVQLDQAVALTFQANVYYHLGVLNERYGNFSDASDSYGKGAAFGGQVGGRSRAALAALWTAAGRDTLLLPDFIETQRRWIEEKNRELVLSKRISRTAPDFQLDDAGGGSVRLSAQRGNPVLLCFWAGWSQASLRVLEELQEMTSRYGRDVMFVTVSTDSEKPGLNELPNGNKLFLPVLIGNGIEKTYGIQGVPMLYIIDSRGQIRFENRGYRPDLKQVLAIQLEDVLGTP